MFSSSLPLCRKSVVVHSGTLHFVPELLCTAVDNFGLWITLYNLLISAEKCVKHGDEYNFIITFELSGRNFGWLDPSCTLLSQWSTRRTWPCTTSPTPCTKGTPSTSSARPRQTRQRWHSGDHLTACRTGVNYELGLLQYWPIGVHSCDCLRTCLSRDTITNGHYWSVPCVRLAPLTPDPLKIISSVVLVWYFTAVPRIQN